MGAPRTGPFRVYFDRVLDASSVNRGTVSVGSGELEAFLSTRFDPVHNAIEAWLFYDEALEPDVLYRLSVDGVLDLDGGRLATRFRSSFTTGDALGDGYVPPVGHVDEVLQLFARSCNASRCHGAEDKAIGLDLSSREGLRATLIGAPSRELSPRGAVEGMPALFGLEGMPLVDVVGGSGRPATSYLLYKLLGDAHIVGLPMPPSPGAPGQVALSTAEIEAVSRWILAGAPTD